MFAARDKRDAGDERIHRRACSPAAQLAVSAC